ncbi:GyrI-like domain-containing protein [Clostridium guangxiense]|uniref:GyrI-like domain-containing protein n=1 Tax=Clostridium guangxiense TaxID=1662055 RepID=UPI001E3F8B52|nr:GyrI-like domain-containing protein [Clostridium guangxiense]MCD2346531.1 GyrI-like domain-containing protein [Clostridium guangxiense]
MESKLDYKKEFKDLYMPKTKPSLIDVPAMKFIMIDGKGDPNEENGEYSKAVELLYALSYTIKMSKKGQNKIEGYFEYVVPPLEGLWWCDEGKIDFYDKSKFHWTSMIRQPEFVTDEVFKWACSEVLKKKPQLDVSKSRFQVLKEGVCVQMMHIGPFDNEPETVNEIEDYIENNSLRNAISTVSKNGSIRRHHEIYLSDPRKTYKQKIKTVLRIPVEHK